MFDEYVEYLYALGLAPATVTVYVRCVERWHAWMVDNTIPAVSALVLAEYAQDIPQTASSRRQHRVALRHWFEMTGTDARIVAAIRVPTKRRGVCRALEPSEASALVNTAVGRHPAGTAVRVLVSGTRQARHRGGAAGAPGSVVPAGRQGVGVSVDLPRPVLGPRERRHNRVVVCGTPPSRRSTTRPGICGRRRSSPATPTRPRRGSTRE